MQSPASNKPSLTRQPLFLCLPLHFKGLQKFDKEEETLFPSVSLFQTFSLTFEEQFFSIEKLKLIALNQILELNLTLPQPPPPDSR